MLNMSISGDRARVNHYILKTYEEFLHKKSRGHPEGIPISYEYYFFHNENDVNDDNTMQRFIPKLKKRMQKSPLPDVSLPRFENMPASFDELYFSADIASQILGQKITVPMNFYEIEKRYKNNYPQYK